MPGLLYLFKKTGRPIQHKAPKNLPVEETLISTVPQDPIKLHVPWRMKTACLCGRMLRKSDWDPSKHFYCYLFYLFCSCSRFRHLRLKQRKLRDYVSEMVDLPKVNNSCHQVVFFLWTGQQRKAQRGSSSTQYFPGSLSKAVQAHWAPV